MFRVKEYKTAVMCGKLAGESEFLSHVEDVILVPKAIHAGLL